MADITVTSIGTRKFHVQIRDDDLETSHHVLMHEILINELQLPEDGLDRVVRESFVFPLEREPASSIMPMFSLDVILATSLSARRSCPKRLQPLTWQRRAKELINDNNTTPRS